MADVYVAQRQRATLLASNGVTADVKILEDAPGSLFVKGHQWRFDVRDVAYTRAAADGWAD